jgi:molybdopterin biosynthesis enzyme
LSSTTEADGFVIVPADSEGFPPGAPVDVFLY